MPFLNLLLTLLQREFIYAIIVNYNLPGCYDGECRGDLCSPANVTATDLPEWVLTGNLLPPGDQWSPLQWRIQICPANCSLPL